MSANDTKSFTGTNSSNPAIRPMSYQPHLREEIEAQTACPAHTASPRGDADNRTPDSRLPPRTPCTAPPSLLPRAPRQPPRARNPERSPVRLQSAPEGSFRSRSCPASCLLPLCPLPSRFPGGSWWGRGRLAPRAPRGQPGPHPRAARSCPCYSVWAAIQQEEEQIHRPKEMQTRWRAKQRSR